MREGRSLPPVKKRIWSIYPFKAVYILGVLCSGLVKIPYWFISFLPPSRRPRRSWSLVRCIRVRIVRHITQIIAPTGMDLSRLETVQVSQKSLRISSFEWIPPVSPKLIRGFLNQAATSVGVRPISIPGYWFHSTPSGHSDPVGPADHVVLHFRGGAYVLGSAHESYICTHITRRLLKHTGIVHTFAADYRVATKLPFPAQLIDALSAYAFLLGPCRLEPKRVIIAGDSAGGNLALALLSYLRDEAVLPMPGGLLLFSPWADMSGTFFKARPGCSVKTNRASDILEMTLGEYALDLFTRGHPKGLLMHPYCSPCAIPQAQPAASFAGFPRTFISSGEAEILRDQIRYLAQLMRRGGVEVTLREERDAIHDFSMMPWMEPESARTMSAINDWVLDVLR